ncbi:MAG: hypothetical protein ABUL60_16000 [Myxococcales bacterium]
MPALYGVHVSLDAASADALAAWLEYSTDSASSGPTIEVEIIADANCAPPVVLNLVLEEPFGWLGRTRTGLIVGGGDRAWFAIEGTPPRIRGALGKQGASEATRDLLLAALVVALRAIGVYAIHAAALARDDQALVLVGDSGAGKSTTAIALVSAGCGFIGDDGFLIRERRGDVELLPLWSHFRLNDDSLASFSALRPHITRRAGDGKSQLDVRAAFPERHLPHWLGRKTVLFLERAIGKSSSLRPLSQAEAVGLLLAQSNALSLECHPDPRRHLDLLARLVSVAKVARLELGTEWLSEPVAAANRLLAQHLLFSRSVELHGEAS